MKRFRRLLMVMTVLGVGSASAHAGSFTLFVDAGLRTMSNSPDTEKAIFADQQGAGAGLGLSYDRNSRWRFGVEVRRISREGQRAFAVDRNSEPFRLGHPLDFTLTEGIASAAFLFGSIGPIEPYLSLGAGRASWKERSNTAGLIEEASGGAALFEAKLGIERQQGPLRFGVEGGVTLVPGAVGVGGISKVYGEEDLGGLFIAFRIGFTKR